MQAWQDLLIQDFTALSNAAMLHDFAMWFQIAFLLILLGVPLNGIDRRDSICSYNYILYLIAAVCFLFFAKPGRWQSWSNWPEHLLTFFFLGLVGLFRWHFRERKRQKTLVEKQINEDSNIVQEIKR